MIEPKIETLLEDATRSTRWCCWPPSAAVRSTPTSPSSARAWPSTPRRRSTQRRPGPQGAVDSATGDRRGQGRLRAHRRRHQVGRPGDRRHNPPPGSADSGVPDSDRLDDRAEQRSSRRSRNNCETPVQEDPRLRDRRDRRLQGRRGRPHAHRAGADVRVIMTRSAQKFVGEQTFAAISGRPVPPSCSEAPTLLM